MPYKIPKNIIYILNVNSKYVIKIILNILYRFFVNSINAQYIEMNVQNNQQNVYII